MQIAHAIAPFEAGASEAARRALHALPADAVSGVAALEVLVISLEIDADLEDDRAVAHRALWAMRGRHEGEADPPHGAGFEWIDAMTSSSTNERHALPAARERVISALAPRMSGDVRARCLAARLHANLVPVLVEAGDRQGAIESLDRAAAFIAGTGESTVGLHALIHVNRAFAFPSSLAALPRAAAEYEAAYALALDHGLPRVLWKCLYLHELERIWSAETVVALQDARTLSASVDASDSCAWRRIARSQLANAETTGGNLDAAERVIASMMGDNVEDGALHASKLEYLRVRYAEAIARAEQLAAYQRVPASVCANALLYSASAAYLLFDAKRAAADISDAVALFESSSMPALFLAQRAYRLAHRLTGRARYRDHAREIQLAFDRAKRAPLRSTDKTLTLRQRQVADLAAGGATNGAIAASLGISVWTVGNHLGVAFAVLGIRARWQLADALLTLR